MERLRIAYDTNTGLFDRDYNPSEIELIDKAIRYGRYKNSFPHGEGVNEMCLTDRGKEVEIESDTNRETTFWLLRCSIKQSLEDQAKSP